MIKFKRLKAMLLAGALAVTTCMAGMTAMAAENNGIYTGGIDLPELKKVLTVPEGVNLPEDGLTFDFTVTRLDTKPAGWTGGYVYDKDKNNVQVNLSETSVTFTNDEVKSAVADADLKKIEKEVGTIEIEPAERVYKHAGIYLYEIAEVPEEKEGLVHNGEKYYLTVFIKEGATSGSYELDKVFVQDKDGTKTDTMVINNTYSPGKLELKISKTLKGDYASKDDVFTFNLKLVSIPSTAKEPTNGYLISNDSQISIDGGATHIKVNDTITFEMKGGQSIRITGLPAGAVYNVTEIDHTGKYKQTYILTEGGVASAEQEYDNGVNNATVTTKAVSGASDTNSVEFINDRSTTTPVTGLIMNNLPFILLIVVAVAGVAAYALLKRKVTR